MPSANPCRLSPLLDRPSFSSMPFCSLTPNLLYTTAALPTYATGTMSHLRTHFCLMLATTPVLESTGWACIMCFEYSDSSSQNEAPHWSVLHSNGHWSFMMATNSQVANKPSLPRRLSMGAVISEFRPFSKSVSEKEQHFSRAVSMDESQFHDYFRLLCLQPPDWGTGKKPVKYKALRSAFKKPK